MGFQFKQTLLALVPHRDVRLLLRKYSGSLFKAGFAGAYLFPWVTPLAALSRPLSADELKNCARALREASLTAENGKINAVETDIAAFSGQALLGPRLDLAISSDVFGEKLLQRPHTEITESQRVRRKAKDLKITPISPLIIGACLLPSAEFDKAALPPAPQLSFRAAAVANMIWQPLEEEACSPGASSSASGSIGYKWKIGKLCWLGAVKKRT